MDKRLQILSAMMLLACSTAVAGSIFERSRPPPPANEIDQLVFAKLETLGIKPVLCSDAVFVRRVYLDVTGKIPTMNEARSFIDAPYSKNKRSELIDELLERPEFADYWSMKWADILRIKAEFPINLWPDAAQVYHHWVRAAVAENKPYDQFVRELLTSSGSNFRVGPVNFYRALQNKTPEGIAAGVALTFMGVRFESWPKKRLDNLGVFFSQVGYKPTNEWKEEHVFWDPLGSTKTPGNSAPGSAVVTTAVVEKNTNPPPANIGGPLDAVFPDGKAVQIPADRDPREVFADWLITPENPWFARCAVNRTWAWLLGRGIIDEPDDIRPDNPPSNPELLAWLEKEFVRSGYDMKHLIRLILNSKTYQLSSVSNTENPESAAQFAAYPLRRLEAEVLIDAINEITGSSDLYTSAIPEPFTYIPKDQSAVSIADGSITSSFLTLFGRSARATGQSDERISKTSAQQQLHLLNSGHIQQKIEQSAKLRKKTIARSKPEQAINNLYLTILSRHPSEEEIKTMLEYANLGNAKRAKQLKYEVWTDMAWALINSPEFLYRH